MSVRPSTNSLVFFRFERNLVCVGRGRYTTVCRMTRSKVKVTEVRMLRKWQISKSISSASMHENKVIKRLTVNCDNPTQYTYVWTRLIFDILPRLARHMTSVPDLGRGSPGPRPPINRESPTKTLNFWLMIDVSLVIVIALLKPLH